MKISIFILPLLFCCTFAQAMPPICTSNSLVFSLDTNLEQKCQLLKIEGIYQIKLCSNDHGLLSGQNESIRYLFKEGVMWVARQDLLDYSNNTADTEILHIDNKISEFVISKIKSKPDGTVLDKINCTGTIQPKQ